MSELIWVVRHSGGRVAEVHLYEPEEASNGYTIEAIPLPSAHDAAIVAAFTAMRENYWTLTPFDMPTGGDDCDIGWTVTENMMGKQAPRVIATHYGDDPLIALQGAMAADAVRAKREARG